MSDGSITIIDLTKGEAIGSVDTLKVQGFNPNSTSFCHSGTTRPGTSCSPSERTALPLTAHETVQSRAQHGHAPGRAHKVQNLSPTCMAAACGQPLGMCRRKTSTSPRRSTSQRSRPASRAHKVQNSSFLGDGMGQVVSLPAAGASLRQEQSPTSLANSAIVPAWHRLLLAKPADTFKCSNIACLRSDARSSGWHRRQRWNNPS
jgi:hypothetical protein